MGDKNKTVLATSLITQLLASPLVTDKESALEIINIMKDMVQKGF